MTVHFAGTKEQWDSIYYPETYLPYDVVFNCDSEKPSYSGFCGDNLTWSFYAETGELVISGTGEMYDYEWGNSPWNDAEWNDVYTAVKLITISDGVTTIGSYAFSPSKNIQNISIARTVKEIGNNAFFDCVGTAEITIPDGVVSIGDRLHGLRFFLGFPCILSLSFSSRRRAFGVTELWRSHVSGCAYICSVSMELIDYLFAHGTGFVRCRFLRISDMYYRGNKSMFIFRYLKAPDTKVASTRYFS